MKNKLPKNSLDVYIKKCEDVLQDELYILRHSFSSSSNWIVKEILQFADKGANITSWIEYVFGQLMDKLQEFNSKVEGKSGASEELMEEYEEADIIYMRFYALFSGISTIVGHLFPFFKLKEPIDGELFSLIPKETGHNGKQKLVGIVQSSITGIFEELVSDMSLMNIPADLGPQVLRIQNALIKKNDDKLDPVQFHKKLLNFFSVVQDTLDSIFENQVKITDENAEVTSMFFTFIMTLDATNLYLFLLYELFFVTYFDLNLEMPQFLPELVEIREEQVSEVHYLALNEFEEHNDYKHLKN